MCLGQLIYLVQPEKYGLKQTNACLLFYFDRRLIYHADKMMISYLTSGWVGGSNMSLI